MGAAVSAAREAVTGFLTACSDGLWALAQMVSERPLAIEARTKYIVRMDPVKQVLIKVGLPHMIQSFAEHVETRNQRGLAAIQRQCEDYSVRFVYHAFICALDADFNCAECSTKVNVETFCYCTGAKSKCHHLDSCCGSSQAIGY